MTKLEAAIAAAERYCQANAFDCHSVLTDETDEILRFVREVADNSNLLGLNAASEAARAGEQGRDFAAVADEIRKMATNSSQSMKDINGILKKIRGETRAVAETIAATAELNERQAAATREISATMQDLTSTAAGLEKLADLEVRRRNFLGCSGNSNRKAPGRRPRWPSPERAMDGIAFGRTTTGGVLEVRRRECPHDKAPQTGLPGQPLILIFC